MTSPNFAYTITTAPFQLFSASHLISLLVFFALLGLLCVLRQKLRAPIVDPIARWSLAGVLALSEISFHWWHLAMGTWSLRESLPLQLCSVTLILSIFMLATSSYRLFEITFFAGIAGAGIALLTPELFYPFPHFRFFHFFVAHEGIVLACLYMSWVKGYRPTFSSVWKSMLTLNALLLIALPVNRWTGGNYLFVSHKPQQAGLMDFLGPYPWYILSLEGVAFLFFTLLYLPFWYGNRVSAHRQSLDA
ncbi:TIGR02206 family membrane protein [Brevibacillus choshinensis]|uniref:TIGR02206 family membrane protein n=1 Tax=Brevibacillus choshinensis TaxID=54911 RepID=A0ABX7FJW8_BRECH|nr:TIGR02206 family membrane protein [Brevibacillus choshinensis]QRG65617.1 TIGR02206 family membrane protein [Brevibacillus choshinensis]